MGTNTAVPVCYLELPIFVWVKPNKDRDDLPLLLDLLSENGRLLFRDIHAIADESTVNIAGVDLNNGFASSKLLLEIVDDGHLLLLGFADAGSDRSDSATCNIERPRWRCGPQPRFFDLQRRRDWILLRCRFYQLRRTSCRVSDKINAVGRMWDSIGSQQLLQLVCLGHHILPQQI